MKFHFDANQGFQRQAVEAVADVLDGQPRLRPGPPLGPHGDEPPTVANRLTLGEEVIAENLRRVQERHGITPDDGLRHLRIETANPALCARARALPLDALRFPNLAVEMETGTGKTYVYIRTMLELHRRYGLRKFIVVVPSVAVREGVLKTLGQTGQHFHAIFDNAVYRYYRYDSSNLSRVRRFAQSGSVEMMVMTIDSFNKSRNVIVRAMDQMQGATPIRLIQATRPVLVLDEPQNFESEASKLALSSLHPILALRYSATHRVQYNIVYRLTPFEAYRRGLVKRIQVASVTRENRAGPPYIRVDAIAMQSATAVAKLRVHKLRRDGTSAEATVRVKPGDRLVDRTGRGDYAGFEVDTIDPREALIRFAPNDVELRLGEAVGTEREAVFRAQIEYTIEQHMRRQHHLARHGVKVLSLFFIDRVASYVGQAEETGMIRRLFDEAFDRIKRKYADWRHLDAGEVRAAYFASKRRRGGMIELQDSSSGENKNDQQAYDLIMRDKEMLLSFPEHGDDEETRKKKRVCFIFSHSALREGWDNPNVFQICTLNHSVSEMRKRQEIGRGVRLARNQQGRLVIDEHVNVLTVIANESYERYVASLQSEIAEEFRAELEARLAAAGRSVETLTEAERRKLIAAHGRGILPPPPTPADRPQARLRRERFLSDEFRQLWERIKHRTRYSVSIDTAQLLAAALPAINRATIKPATVEIAVGELGVQHGGFTTGVASRRRRIDAPAAAAPLPNLMEVTTDLMERTAPPVRLTRATLLAVLRQTTQRQAMVENPHEFARVAVQILKNELLEQLVAGISYEHDGTWWDMSRIEDEESFELFSKYAEPSVNGPALHDMIPCDSETERQFVRDLEGREDVLFYMKLPGWFRISTPLGDHHPDWAVVLRDGDQDSRLFLVVETRSPRDPRQRRRAEQLRLRCAARHFDCTPAPQAGASTAVEYTVVTSASQLPPRRHAPSPHDKAGPCSRPADGSLAYHSATLPAAAAEIDHPAPQ